MTKILLVEDDNSLREIYGVRLTAEGYAVVSAADGEKALALAISERPDLIVSDVMMPRISGFEMLDLLRGNESTRNIKVIMLTALSSEHQRERGDALGADRYLVKSQVGIEDIVRTVHEVLNDQNGQRTVEQMETSTRAAHDAQVNAQKSQSESTIIINRPTDNNLPASGQSAFNPLAATSPNVVAGRPLPNLPNTPLQVPSYNQPPVQNSADYYQGNPVMYGQVTSQQPTTPQRSVQTQPHASVTQSKPVNQPATPAPVAPAQTTAQAYAAPTTLTAQATPASNAQASQPALRPAPVVQPQPTPVTQAPVPAAIPAPQPIAPARQTPTANTQGPAIDPRINLTSLLGEANGSEAAGAPFSSASANSSLFPNG